MSDNEEENSDQDNRLDKIEIERDELAKRISEEENRLKLEKEKLAETYDGGDEPNDENFYEAPSESGPVNYIMYMLDPLQGKE